MKLRNPWIDPRILQVRPEAAQAYLETRGWKPLGPAVNPLLLAYEGPGNGGNVPTVLVPRQTDEGPMLQRMIDLVGEVALFEKRYAGHVLDEMLQHPPEGEPNGALGSAAENAPTTEG